MTLDEMIAQEQQNVKAETTDQKAVNTQEASESADSKMQTNANTTAATSTIASSSDENVDRSQFSLKVKKYSAPLIPEDFYTVKLIGIDKKEAKDWNSDEVVPNFVWKMEVISDSNGEPLKEKTVISKWCKAYSKGENSNNYKYYEAFMKQTPQDGYNILDCIGKYARAYITQYTKVDSKTGLKTQKSVIEKLLKLQK